MSNNNIWNIINIKKDVLIPKRKIINSKQKLINLKSISYTNNTIQDLNPVVWVDASDLTSLQRDSNNNVYQILDKSGNNNHLSQSVLANQPKYHNGGLLFNSDHYLVGNNTLNQDINNMSIFIVLKQYNQSLNQGILSGFTDPSDSDASDPNAFSFRGADGDSDYGFITNNVVLNVPIKTSGDGDYLTILTGMSSSTNSLQMISSPDNINWTINQSMIPIINNQEIFNSITAIKYNGTIWLACGYGYNSSGLVTSTDGITWSLVTGFNPTNTPVWMTLEWNGSMWLLGGYDNSNSIGLLYSSTDGINWSSANYPGSGATAGGQVWNIKWGGGIWMMFLNGYINFNPGPNIYYSSDGSNWNAGDPTGVLNNYSNCSSLEYNGSLWICSGSLYINPGTPFMVYSTDGITWEHSSSGETLFDNGCYSVKWNGSIWVAAGSNTPLAYSTNGIDWTAAASGTGTTSAGITVIWSGSLWIAGCNNSLVLTSTDGINWDTNAGASALMNSVDGSGANSSSVPIPYVEATIPYGTYEIVINNNVGSMYNNGTLINTKTFTGLGSFTNLVLGARSNNSFYNYFNGEIYELIILNSAVSTSDRYSIENYLSDKWSTTQISRTPPLSNIYSWLDASSKNNFTLDQNNNVISWNDKNSKLNFKQYNPAYSPIFDANKVIFNNSFLTMNDTDGLDLNNYSIFLVTEELSHNNSSGILTSTNNLNLNTDDYRDFKGANMVAGSSTINNKNSLIYSYDGINWIPVKNNSSIFSSTWALAYNGSIWVAGGVNSTNTASLAYSYDGINWINSPNNIFLNGCKALAWNGSMWVAGGSATNPVAYSYDGINWTPSANGNSVFLDGCTAVATNGPLWLAVTDTPNNSLLYSLDGITWQRSVNGNSFVSLFKIIAWNGSIWVASTESFSKIFGYSYDGDTWFTGTYAPSIIGGRIKSFAWNGLMWVASNNGFAYSYDGITWTASNTTNIVSSTFFSVTWNGSMWIGAGSGLGVSGQIAYSYDGIYWLTSSISSISNNSISITSKNLINNFTEKFTVTIGTLSTGGGQICYSFDGIKYIPSSSTIFTSGNSVRWNGSLWIAVGTNGSGGCIAYSSNGINWTEAMSARSIFTNSVTSVAWNGNKWIAGGTTTSGGTIAYSTDGIIWTESLANLHLTYTVDYVAASDKLFVAGGQTVSNSTIFCYSYDGNTWTPYSTLINAVTYFIGWNGTIWVASGLDTSNGVIFMYSLDGINWTLSGSFTYSTKTPITWNGTIWLALFSTQYIATSSNGTVWTAQYSGSLTSQPLTDLTWNGTIWTVSGYNNPYIIYYSPDGINWINIFNNFPNNSNAIINGISSRRALPYLKDYIDSNGGGISLEMNDIKLNYIDTQLTLPKKLYEYNINDGIGTVYVNGVQKSTVDFGVANTGNDFILGSTINNVELTNFVVAGGTSNNKIIYSYDGLTWIPSSSGNSLFNVAIILRFNGKLWLAGGTGDNRLAYSYDGINWSSSTSGNSVFSNNVTSIGCSESLWVAGGLGQGSNTNTMGYSYDGINWNISISGCSLFSLNVFAITFANSLWVASGNNNFGYSYDGITWSSSSSGTSIYGIYAASAITFANNMWISGGGGGIMAYSYDGINWTQITSVFTTQIYGINWNGKIWIAGGYGTNVLAYSHNGINWTAITAANSLFTDIVSLAWNGIVWIVGSYGSTYKMAYSYNGINWIVNTNTLFNTQCVGITSSYTVKPDLNNFVLAGGNGLNVLGYSYDGINWYGSNSANLLFNITESFSFNGSLWLAGGAGTNRIASSSDGINWVSSSSGNSVFSNNLKAIENNGSFWVAGGLGTIYNINSMGYSPDGINWFASTSGCALFTSSVRTIKWADSMWVAGGSGTSNLGYSYDGITWVGSSSGSAIYSSEEVQIVAYGNNMWISGSLDGGIMAYSYDGINWTQITSPFTGIVRGICWNGKIWVASGNGTNALVYSYDAINWTPSTSGNNLFSDATGLAWNGSVWVVGSYGAANKLGYSYDGIIWYPSPNSPFDGFCLTVTSRYVVPSNLNNFVVAGGNTMIYSYDGLTWINSTSGSSLFTTVNAVGYNSSLWVAGGTGANRLAYSNDGIDWTSSSSGNSVFSVNVKSVASNGSIWVAGGLAGSGQNTYSTGYSSDGINWSISTSGSALFTINLQAIGWGNSIWIGGGDGTNKLGYSYNGVLWYSSSSGNAIYGSSSVGCVAFGNNMWVSGGSGGKMAYSYNGINWTVIASVFGISGQVYGLGWNGYMWVAGGNGTNILAYSFNGINWVGSTSGNTVFSGLSVTSITWNESIWIACSSTILGYSFDGINWITNTPGARTVYSKYTPSIKRINKPKTFVLASGGANNTLASSINGLTWTPNISASSIFESISCIGTNNKIWIIGGKLLSNSQGCVYYSYDGINLINSISGSALFATQPADVKWNGSMWIMTGVIPTFVPRIAYSYDGINWKAAANVSSIFNQYTTKIAWGKSVWVVGGGNNGSMGYSYDGITWYRSSTGNTIFPAAVNALAYNGTIFIAGGYGSGQMAYSNNGINWVQITSVFTTQCSCVEWNGKMWVAGGNGTNTIGYSYDGINWTGSSSANALWSNTFSITWNGSFWIAGIAGSNPIGYSYDGINWIVNVNAPFNSYSGTVTGYYQTIYNNTQSNNFMITGTYTSTYNMYYSIDGLNWTPSISASTVFSNSVLCIKYNGLIWVTGAEGGTNRLGYSYDGLTWTPSSSGNSVFSNNVRTLASNGSFWVAGGLALSGFNTNSMGYSLNGINWSVSTSGSSLFGNINVLGWGNSLWIAAGGNPNSLAYSTDGINWTASSSSNAIFGNYSAKALAFGNNMWVCGGGISTVSIMTYSYDGINWFPITSVFSGYLFTIGYNGIIWVANGYGLFVSAYSYDGINWTGSDSSNLVFGMGAIMTNLTWTGSFWIASGNAGTSLIGYSYDGINWISNPLANSLVTGGWFSGLTSQYFIPATKPLNANMHELIVLNKSAPYNERSKIYSYLSEKWNLPITNGPALNSTIWLDSNNNSYITVDGSNNILTWSDISNNRYPITINGTKPILQTVNNMKVAYFNGSDVNIGIPPFTGSNNTIYIVFSANTNTTTNSRLISFNNGTNDYSSSSFNVNSNTNNGTLQYNTTSNYYQTIPFNNNLYIYTIQTNNNNVNISINNYLVNSFTNSQNYNYITLDLGSLSGNSKNWIGYIPEFIYYNTALDTNSHTGTIKYLANKWSINLDSPLINEYIPRITSPINKYMPLTNIFQNTSYITISDTPYKSGTINFDINVPIQDTLPNQLTIKTIDPVYLSVIDKNTLYNIIEFVGSCSIVLPILTYDNDYFAFRNSGIYDVTITGPNSLSVVINPSQTIYFTYNAGTYTQSSTFAGFNCTLNKYDNSLSNNYILYIGGWSKELSYITNLYIIYNSTSTLTGPIYYDQTYQADFTLSIAPGTYTLIISDTPTTGNIINYTITSPLVLSMQNLFSDYIYNFENTLTLNYADHTEKYEINPTIGYLNINNIYTISLSNTENYDLTTYEKSWNIYCNDILITTTELANNQTLTFNYTPTEISDSLYFSVSTATNKLLSKVNTPIIIINPSFTIQNNDTGYKLNLIEWNSKINNNLYIFDTNTNKLLITVNSQNTLFNYKFPRAQNYLTISDTNDMSGLLNYIINEPFVVNPLLIIQVKPTSNNWGYFNISKSYSFTLSSYYDDTPVNYTDYYSTIDVYYTDVFITTVMVINNQINFTFTFDPTKITNKQGNFNFKNSKISTQSSEYIFFDRNSLKFTLNNNILTSNININAQLYVYANQSYLCDVTNSIVNFPNLNKGTYYLTISNIDKNNIRTINDINVDIDTPLIIKNIISKNNTIIIDDTTNNTEIILPEPIIVTKSIINNNSSKSIIGKLDDINIHSIDLHDNYENIQVNNSKIVIDHTIDNNKIIFSYDSGFESNVIFNIINSVTFEIYESIDVTYL